MFENEINGVEELTENNGLIEPDLTTAQIENGEFPEEMLAEMENGLGEDENE